MDDLNFSTPSVSPVPWHPRSSVRSLVMTLELTILPLVILAYLVKPGYRWGGPMPSTEDGVLLRGRSVSPVLVRLSSERIGGHDWTQT